jgi:RNA polymerase sigma-70 factor (ECF subfamily)
MSAAGLRSRQPESDGDTPVDPSDSTAILIARVKKGDEQARDKLASRYLAVLRRWAHGRLPARARDLVDTDDLVQSALFRGLTRLDRFEDRGDGAFLAYVRQILLNRIRDESRRASRRPEHEELDSDFPADALAPLELLVRRERLEAYERALASLSPTRREALILRLEMGFRYREIAEAMGLPSGNAARLLASRAFLQLSRALKEES